MSILTTEQQERVKALAAEHLGVQKCAFLDGEIVAFAAAFLSEFAPSLRVNPVTVAYSYKGKGRTMRAYWADKPMHQDHQPLGAIMEADKVDELMELRAENAAYDLAAMLFHQPHIEYFGSDIQESILALKHPNDARIAEIEGKT